MRIGQMVMLVGCDHFMPPLGAVGEIVGALDSYNDYEVLFQHYPCPVSEITWEIPAKWLMPLLDPPLEISRVWLDESVVISEEAWRRVLKLD